MRPETVQDLTVELDSLRSRRQQIDARIASIELLLRPESGMDGRQGASASTLVGQPQPFIGLGIRDAVRTVIAAAPGRGLTSGEVADQLAHAGFQVRGSQPLRDRVYNTIHKLKTSGEITERGGRRYVPAARQEEAP